MFMRINTKLYWCQSSLTRISPGMDARQTIVTGSRSLELTGPLQRPRRIEERRAAGSGIGVRGEREPPMMSGVFLLGSLELFSGRVEDSG